MYCQSIQNLVKTDSKQVGRFGDAIWQVCPQLVLTPCIENMV